MSKWNFTIPSQCKFTFNFVQTIISCGTVGFFYCVLRPLFIKLPLASKVEPQVDQLPSEPLNFEGSSQEIELGNEKISCRAISSRMFLAITFDAYLLVKKTDYCDRCSSEFKLILS